MRTLALIVAACGADAGANAVVAQVAANIEAGVSEVRYDGFLTSTAASVSPTIRWEHPRGRSFVSARGTYLRFESGRHSLDGSANGSWFVPLAPRVRAELGVSAGASQYASITSFSHSEAEARLHLMSAERGVWAGASAGRSYFSGVPRNVVVLATGFWLLRRDKTMFVSLDRSFIGDTGYSDMRASGRWRGSRLVLEGIVGARVWSRGGGRGVYGEGSAALTLGPEVALVLSAGRYPTDAVSGSIAGRYVTAALRVGTIPIRRPAPHVLPVNEPVYTGSDGAVKASETRLTIQIRPDDVLLTVYAAGAASVEITGDFTDWQPVPLNRGDGDTWAGVFRMTAGIHRLNVRRDGGPWIVPTGAMRRPDDYDGEVGVFVLP